MSATTFVVPEDAHPERVDKLLARSFPEVSRGAIQRSIEMGRTQRKGGEALQSKQKLLPGDVLLVDFTPETVPGLRPVEIPLEILHEDEDIVVLNKSSGMVVHPGDGTGEDTLVHALLHHCGDNLSHTGAPERPGIVHRLDKETSGVMVVAKTDVAHKVLAERFSSREIVKKYLAVVVGVPGECKGSIRLPIGRHPKVRVKMAVSENGKPAHTDWEVVEGFGGENALVECLIHTGRTHQIRVHLSYLGHAIAGDLTYGYKPGRQMGLEAPRVLLHAHSLCFAHPVSGEQVSYEAELPGDFENYTSALREHFGGDAVA